MSIFSKTVGDYVRFVRIGLVLLVGMGLVRFVVGISGVLYERATHLTSVTIVVFLLAIIYGQRAAALRFGGYRHLIPVALVLSGTMYGFIIMAMVMEGLGEIHGFFHSPGSGFAPQGMGLSEHITGQLRVMPAMTVAILGVTILGYALSRHLVYLRDAFLLLAALAMLRFVAGVIGIPYFVGTWLTSLTLLSIVLAIYYGYRAPAAGFDGYRNALLIALMIAFVTFHLVVYGFVVSDALGVSTYYSASATTVQEQIKSHLRLAPWLVLVLAALGYAASKRGFSTGKLARPRLGFFSTHCIRYRSYARPGSIELARQASRRLLRRRSHASRK